MVTLGKIFEELLNTSEPKRKEGLLHDVSSALEQNFNGTLAELSNALAQTPSAQSRSVEVPKAARQTWSNFVGNQIAQPLQIFRPRTLMELLAVIQQAQQQNCKVKAVGSGHSHSEVALTADFLIDTHGLKQVLALDTSVLKSGVEIATLVHAECGIRICDLNEELEQRNLALLNMGGYTAQTIIGAISTGTHGSGLAFGPLADFIEALELIAEDGTIYRIEPSNGITDPQRFREKYLGLKLVQDDDWFRAVAVSLGVMGVIYSVILRVTQKYWLNETRTVSTWNVAKEELRAGEVLRAHRHYEVLVNPYAINGRHSCLITTRDLAEEPKTPSFDRSHRNFFAEMIAAIPGIDRSLLLLLDTFPDLTPRILEQAMKGLEDKTYTDKSYKVLDLGAANKIKAYSAEIGLPLRNCVGAVERIFQVTEDMRRLGKIYMTSPMSLRFVKASPAYMAMMHGRDTCMIELPIIDGTHGGYELLRKLEEALYEFGGRPHWGQINFVTGNNGLVEAMYPAYPKWLEVYHALHKSGMFENSFTARLGFSTPKFVAHP